MHHDFWHERWQTGQTGFHQSDVHPFLARWWPQLALPREARVYVPLCGKSLDMVWLAARGHAVVGSELSPIAIREFFAARGLEPTGTDAGALPPDLRRRYADSLARLLPRGAKALLIAFEYPQEMKGGPPFSVDAAEIRELFEPAFELEQVERLDVLAQSPKFAEVGIPALFETAFLMQRR